MTKNLEDELNLPHLDDLLKLEKDARDAEELERIQEVETELDELRHVDLETANSFETALTRAQRLEQELADHAGLRQHDAEMDEIAKEAIESYHEFKDLAINCTPAHAGKIAETAVNMLRVSLDAKNAKADKKLRTWRLKLDQAKLIRDLEKDEGPQEGTIDSEDAIRIDRNRLLQQIQDTLSQDNEFDKKELENNK
ncbi:MAG: hypothetical protein HC836_32835 [Richelia sp. RM2_1_2]|nr:hypothetical protein [Richelia sp. RM2_1_2]